MTEIDWRYIDEEDLADFSGYARVRRREDHFDKLLRHAVRVRTVLDGIEEKRDWKVGLK